MAKKKSTYPRSRELVAAENRAVAAYGAQAVGSRQRLSSIMPGLPFGTINLRRSGPSPDYDVKLPKADKGYRKPYGW